ncbi:MAG TPA: phosphoribosyltransferase, partial [Planctomycetota bacterium]|nr:phosphoribosyltransferase [Planctomycetota bacterium]
ATGATMAAGIDALRRAGAGRIVAAAPVAAPEAAAFLRSRADEVVLLHVPADFGAVSRYYRDFRQVTDEEVVALLRDERRRKAS